MKYLIPVIIFFNKFTVNKLTAMSEIHASIRRHRGLPLRGVAINSAGLAIDPGS
jgi:hypothetical protein